jgi:serine/threonine protein kinase
MNAGLRELFREIAEIPMSERERILAERPIPADLRSEVESLLRCDSASVKSLTRPVHEAAEQALQWANGPASGSCGPFRLVRVLGSGGMGAVYLGERRDGEIEQKAAIKLLRADADRPAWRERFLRERQLLAYLNHPSIARLLDAGHTDDGRPYLVMEYVDGVAIDDYAAQLDLHGRLRLFLLVCDAVSHAHRHLIIHRDLKPSNILVDSSGQPKLLDFGIAKLLAATADETGTVERLLTPSYASPEQLRGDVQTVATDIYSLGAVLHKLLTGHPPRELFSRAQPQKHAMAGEDAGTVPVCNTNLARDLEHILRKTLRCQPKERYASVDALADDVRAYLDSRPVQARSGNTWYRARKFFRRHRVGVAAAAAAAASLWAGLIVANHQRQIALARFQQVRQLANRSLTIGDMGRGMYTPSKAVREIVAISKEHLETLAADAHADQALALEVGGAYSVLARVQGIYTVASPGQRASAEESLRKASLFVEPVVSASPDNRQALLTAARISHHRMILAENQNRNSEAVEEGRRAAAHLERLLEVGPLSPAESEQVSELFYEIALSSKNQHLTQDGVRFARRSVEIARSSPNAALGRSLALSMLADLLRLGGDLEGALQAIREARASLEGAHFPNETARRSSLCRVLGREGKILAAISGISLNRVDEAVPVVQQAFDVLEEWRKSEPENTWTRLLYGSLGREYGDLFRLRDPQKALAIYDHSLRRVQEVQDNPEARRAEAELLTSSAYPLRRLNRSREAEERIAGAFRLLAATNDYPSDRLAPYTPAYEVLHASGDHFFETGQLPRAIETYDELLAKVMASKPDPQNDLRHAMALSKIFDSLAALYRRGGEREKAAGFSERRSTLWRHWERKLPNNSFISRQLASARTY